MIKVGLKLLRLKDLRRDIEGDGEYRQSAAAFTTHEEVSKGVSELEKHLAYLSEEDDRRVRKSGSSPKLTAAEMQVLRGRPFDIAEGHRSVMLACDNDSCYCHERTGIHTRSRGQ